MNIDDPQHYDTRARAFYFQGLPVQPGQPSALVTALARSVQVEPVTFFNVLDKPSKHALSLCTLIQAAVADILVRQPSGEINLIGYSIGGYAVMHVASRLEDEGRTVGFVALLDSSAYYPFKSEPSLKERLAGRKTMGLPKLLALHLLTGLLHQRRFELARWLTLLAIWLRGRRAAGDLVSKTLALYWKEAVLRFPPRRYGGKVYLFVAERGRPRITDPFLGWGPFAGQIVKIVLEGDHWTLTEPPMAAGNAQVIARTLQLAVTEKLGV